MTEDTNTTDDTALSHAVETFVRDARRVYEEYEEDYLDPDAALWTLEGHIDSLEATLNDQDGRN